MRFSRIVRDLRLEISTMIFLAGLILTILTLNHYVFRPSLPDFFLDIDNRIGPWIVWVAVVGPLILMIGGWYFQDTIRKQREFKRLIQTDSKAKFVRDQTRLVEIARILGTRYWNMLEDKAASFRLK